MQMFIFKNPLTAKTINWLGHSLQHQLQSPLSLQLETSPHSDVTDT